VPTKTTTLSDGAAQVEFHVEPPLDFEGVFRPAARIQYYGPLRDRVSMANVSVQICRVLLRSFGDAEVAIHNYVPGGSQWIDPALEAHAGRNPGAKLGIFYGVPVDVPENFFRHPIRIGGFVCETDQIEPSWVDICNRFDLIVVPSHWCRETFVRSGVDTPVLVVPHGLDPEYRPYGDKPRTGPLTFYNTFYATSYCSRKSLEELVRAFLTAFHGRSDVVLRLRTDSRAKLAELRERYDFGDLIRVESIPGSDTETYARIYSEVHCTVHPSKGEGFGMVPFQSIASETPVIALHETGMADYLTDDNSIRLKSAGRIRGEGTGNAVGTYFAIDEAHLVSCLRHTAEHWEEEYAKVRRAAPVFRAAYEWEQVLAKLITVVRELLASESAAEKCAVLQQRVDGGARRPQAAVAGLKRLYCGASPPAGDTRIPDRLMSAAPGQYTLKSST